MIITTNDFDEIVLNNPFLKDGNVGYGFEKLFWKYRINYDPEALKFNGQTNSTCKYIILESYFSKKTIKVIREDNKIVVQEFTLDNDDLEIVNDEKRLLKIKGKLIDLNKIVKKQILKHNKSLSSLTKIAFDIDSVIEFVHLIYPKLSKNEVENLIEELKNAEDNPKKYIGDLSSRIIENKTLLTQKILFNIITNELEKTKKIIIVDWKSPHEEVYNLFSEQFNKLEISFKEELDKPKKYETTNYIKTINELVKKSKYKMVLLGGVSDTFLITFSEKENFGKIKIKAEKLKIELSEWT